MPAAQHFSQTYVEARTRFLDAARDAGAAVQSHLHPMRGHDGEEMAMDVVRLGAADAPGLLVISSACHGVEGYCGSGVQVALLRDAAWRDAVRAGSKGPCSPSWVPRGCRAARPRASAFTEP